MSCYVADIPQYDSKFNMNSLRVLEEMTGLDIVAPLADRYRIVMVAAQISLSKSQKKKLEEYESSSEALEYVIEHWKPGSSKEPRTWRSLLRVLNFVKGDLKTQIANILGK